jgi:DNA repair exonuclease SbcCD ATPase subunit
MKLLKKQQINERVQTERKNTIDAGVFLAKKIDALREEILTLQKTRDDFIAGSQQVINDSLSSLQQKQDSLQKEIKELEAKRKELLIPLDDEWERVNQIKYDLLQEKEELEIAKDQMIVLQNETANEKEKISKTSEQIRYKEQEAEKARNDILGLKELAQKEYETARSNRETFDKENERKLSELQQKIETYDNGISVNELKEKDLEKREVALLSERKHLESQQRTFLIAKGIK